MDTPRADRLHQQLQLAVNSLTARGLSIDDAVELINRRLFAAGMESETDGHLVVRIEDREAQTLMVDVEGWSKDRPG